MHNKFIIPKSEPIDFSYPKDITSQLDSDMEKLYREFGIRMFAVNLDYLIQNSQKLAKEEDKDNYKCPGQFKYYSPNTMEYDFTTNEGYIKGKPDDPAMILYKEQRIPIYLPEPLLEDYHEIALKSYKQLSKNGLEPTLLLNPVFSVNLNLETNQLIPLTLISFDKVILMEHTKFYAKVMRVENIVQSDNAK